MIKLIKGELSKLAKRRMTWILVVVMVVYFAIILFATYGVVSSPPERMSPQIIDQIRSSLQFPGAFETIFSTARTILTLLVIILVASSIGNEYGWGSIRQILSRRGIRYQFVVSKLVSLIFYALIGLVLALITGFVLILIIASMLGPVTWDFLTAGYIGEMAETFGWTLFTLLPYIALTAFFAFLGRSAIAGIGGGLGFYFIEAILVTIFNQSGGWLAEIPAYLIGPNIDALVPASLFTQGPFGSSGDLPSVLHASIALAIYCVVLISASLVMFEKRDIVLQ
ncbi:MAG: ABC transporter permease subunit [Dehalococcoidaceae bacterium]|nr:ABC transporter permease subunit [Dehalococcoidaceae bacterium]